MHQFSVILPDLVKASERIQTLPIRIPRSKYVPLAFPIPLGNLPQSRFPLPVPRTLWHRIIDKVRQFLCFSGDLNWLETNR